MYLVTTMRTPDRPPTDCSDETGSRRLWLGLLRFARFAAAVALALALGGFLQFATDVADLEPTGGEHAEGIVVLTGGRDRIHGAVELLKAGRGQRLLITGVHHLTRAETLRRQSEGDEPLFACCVDLGFQAASTVGNAQETAAWATARRFRSLIVVTSAYHMPRSLAEFTEAMPGIVLIPYPIRHAELDLARWYLSTDTAKLLMLEYLKYTVSRARQAFELN